MVVPGRSEPGLVQRPLSLSLAAAEGMVAGARFDRDRMAAAASDELIAATDLADLLVKRGTISGADVWEAMEKPPPLGLPQAIPPSLH